MITFYNEKGQRLGQAWSVMKCKKARERENHTPHSHNPEFAMYGPYMCEGYPKSHVYDTPPRKPANP